MTPLPAIKIHVDTLYLTQRKQKGFTEAYLMGVDARMSDALKFTVYLESGAVWSGLPIEALYCDRFGAIAPCHWSNEILQPYSCLDGPVSVIRYKLLKNAKLIIKDLGAARYLFTINYQGGGLADDPEQFKTHNVIVLDEFGVLAAVPNNYMKVADNWFGANIDTRNYRRNNKHYFAGG